MREKNQEELLKHAIIGGVVTCIVIVIYASLSIFVLKDITGVVFALIALFPVSSLLNLLNIEDFGVPLLIGAIVFYFLIGTILGTIIYFIRRKYEK